MVKLAKASRVNPAIRYLTAGLIQNVPAKDYRSEVETIFEWVKANIRYTQDINDVETIQFPENTIEFGYGDCDDMALLLASMLESVGHPTQFVAVGFGKPYEFDHVFVRSLVGTRWISLDPTEPNPMGWEPPGITSYIVRYI